MGDVAVPMATEVACWGPVSPTDVTETAVAMVTTVVCTADLVATEALTADSSAGLEGSVSTAALPVGPAVVAVAMAAGCSVCHVAPRAALVVVKKVGPREEAAAAAAAALSPPSMTLVEEYHELAAVTADPHFLPDPASHTHHTQSNIHHKSRGPFLSPSSSLCPRTRSLGFAGRDS